MKIMWMAAGAAVIAIGVAATVHAHQGGPRIGFWFERADLDGDGVVTQSEAETLRAERFQTADTNGDGALDEAEVAAALEARKAARRAWRFQRLDTDGDGVLSMSEVAQRMARRFERLDADGDGAITRSEAREARARMRHGGKRDHKNGDVGE